MVASPPTPPAAGQPPQRVLLPALRNFVIGAAVLGVLLSLLAGSFRYWQGWVFSVLFAFLTTAQGVYLAYKDPALLARRQQIAAQGESRAQRLFIIVGLVSNLGLLVLAALDHRFAWSRVPVWVCLAGDALLVLSFYLYYLVFKENSYAASSIQTFAGQQVISTGLYALVRHPKYLGDLLLVLGSALALGSWWALVFVLLAAPALAWRIGDEEKLLTQNLPGYAAYTRQVRYRLVPYLW
jgi:protein-S-isoprenylcysteine O-methyltransferase Ste14